MMQNIRLVFCFLHVSSNRYWEMEIRFLPTYMYMQFDNANQINLCNYIPVCLISFSSIVIFSFTISESSPKLVLIHHFRKYRYTCTRLKYMYIYLLALNEKKNTQYKLKS